MDNDSIFLNSKLDEDNRICFAERFMKIVVGAATQEEIAKRIRTSRQNVGNWISGKAKPDIYALAKISKAYNVSADYLLGLTDIRSKGLESMNNGNSGLFDGTAGKIISELNDKLREAEDKARYWQEKYEKALHDYLDLEKAAEKCSGELMTMKERLSEVVAENHILKQSCFFGNGKRAHDIALAALKMEWKKGEIHHQNDSGSMRYYLAAYKYILEQLEADQKKD